ncbi:hypothetical protein CPB84DRAFT_1847705 [Gymnopilus junonius]|uniref:Uncharacterized protein n=1 Tax=Gymnopilus junonius TaxID=109634 RepID=A0A9P5TMH5_GYMJU|nr:hypothetical protein CPB84DRAFT_1847705 [Gymnopilus junonius]
MANQRSNDMSLASLSSELNYIHARVIVQSAQLINSDATAACAWEGCGEEIDIRAPEIERHLHTAHGVGKYSPAICRWGNCDFMGFVRGRNMGHDGMSILRRHIAQEHLKRGLVICPTCGDEIPANSLTGHIKREHLDRRP